MTIYDLKKVMKSFDDSFYYKNGKLKMIFSRNQKMIETTEANPGKYFINVNLPARITCPCRGECEEFCYATQGRYVFKNVIESMEFKYKMSKLEEFRWFVFEELKYWRRKAKGAELYVRVHDSGDYYSIEYARKWLDIARDNPDCVFYSYTKCVDMWHTLYDNNEVPENYRIIMSTQGSQDLLIRPDDRIAIVVQDESCIKEGMVNGTGNDYYATYAKIVALPYHGSKKVKV